MSPTEPTPNAALTKEGDWTRCRKGSCQRHQACMYIRCLATPSPAAQDETAKGLEVVGNIVWWKAGGVNFYPANEPFRVDRSCRVQPLTDHATATRQLAERDARIAELLQERDAWVDRTDAALDLQENERTARLAAEADAARVRENTGAQAVIRDGKIEISIAVDALPLIVSSSCAARNLSGLWKVTDEADFAKEVCHALNAESENGTTRVHLMFDAAFDHVIEQGGEGIDEAGEEEFEAEAERLQALAQTQRGA